MGLNIKYRLIEKIVQTEDNALLEEIQALPESRDTGYQIPETHRQVLDQRLAEDEASPQADDDWRTVLNRIRKEV